jgi:hypothetical protein
MGWCTKVVFAFGTIPFFFYLSFFVHFFFHCGLLLTAARWVGMAWMAFVAFCAFLLVSDEPSLSFGCGWLALKMPFLFFPFLFFHFLFFVY